MIKVTCAIIRNEDDEILIVQRGEKSDHPFKWEFPGGKLAEGASDEDCIIREIKEELSMDIIIRHRMENVEYDYGKKQIMLIPFICETLDELPFLSEHISYKWLSPDALVDIDLSEADVLVANNYLRSIETDEVRLTATIRSGESSSIDDDLTDMINRMISTKEVDWIASSALENSSLFNKLIEYSYSPDRKLAFRSSWALSKVCDKDPEIVYPFLSSIIESLHKVNNESTERSFLRIISLSDLIRVNGRCHGILADHCFKRLRSGFSAIAVKAYSMEIIYRLAIIYPELINELAASVSMLQGEGSAGIIARGRIILNKLARLS